MRKIFITYGDDNYRESIARICREAEAAGVFDEVRAYTPEMLPEPFRGYTAAYRRGGGYWLWKPYVIYDALERAGEGDVVVYADAGCTVNRHRDWTRYFDILRRKDYIFFLTCTWTAEYCKREVLDFFRSDAGGRPVARLTGNQAWALGNQVQATFMLVRKAGGNGIIARWKELAEHRPALFTDIAPEERGRESARFREHRHDQALLTGCVCTSDELARCRFFVEKMEKIYPGGQAVVASRISPAHKGFANARQSRAAATVKQLFSNPLRTAFFRLLCLCSRI